MKNSGELYNKGLKYYNKSEYSQAVSYFRQATTQGNMQVQKLLEDVKAI